MSRKTATSCILRAVASSRPFSQADLDGDDETGVRQAVAAGIGFKWTPDDPGQVAAAEMPVRVNGDAEGLTVMVPDPPGWEKMSESPDSGQKNADERLPPTYPE